MLTSVAAPPTPGPEPAPRTPLGEAARAYAEAGFPVFPVKPRGKEPLVRWRDGASSRPEKVSEWWAQWPDANIGLPVPEGLFVLDIDGPEGEQTIAGLEARHGRLPEGPVGRTAKGRHLWFRFPPGRCLENAVKRLPGIDVRAHGGYVVAPPSVHPDGVRYQWETGRALSDVPIPEAPGWLLDALEGTRASAGEPPPGQPPCASAPATMFDFSNVSVDGSGSRLAGILATMRTAAEGERNAKLFWCACRLVELEQKGETPASAWEQLREAARAIGLEASEVDRTIASARRSPHPTSAATANGAAPPPPPPMSVPAQGSGWPGDQAPGGAPGAPPPGASPPGAPHPTGWPDPEPLLPPGAEPAPYPLDALPDVIREAVVEYQAFGKQPMALVATSALAAASLACQGHADIERLPGLTGPIALHFVTIAVSGERKTSADKWFKGPFYGWLRRYEELYVARIIERFGSFLKAPDLEVLKNTIKALKEQLGRLRAKKDRARDASDADTGSKQGADTGSTDEIEERKPKKSRKAADLQDIEREISEVEQTLAERNEDLAVRSAAPPRLFLEDTTPEALAEELEHGWPSRGLWSDEGGLVVGGHAMGEETVMRFLALLDKLWDATPFTRDRTTKASFQIRGRRVTVDLMVQPDVARNLISGHEGLARGIGFLARYLVCWPASTIGSRQIDPETERFSWPARRRFKERIAALMDLPLPARQTLRGDRELDPPLLSLSTEASLAWIAFHNEIERSLARTGEFGDVQDVGAESAEPAARLAGVFHVFEHGSEGAIDLATMERATRVARWYLAEARRVLGTFECCKEVEDARLLLDWLRKHPGASLRDISQKGPYRLRKKERRDRALAELVRRNLCRINTTKVELSPRLVEIEQPAPSVLGGEPGLDVPF